MEIVITLLAVSFGIWTAFRHGKSLGSRKAFNIGYRRGRERFHNLRRR